MTEIAQTIKAIDAKSDQHQPPQLLSKLFMSGALVDIEIRSWQARRNAKSMFAELGIPTEAWNDKVLVGTQMKFIDDDTRKSFHEHEVRARIWLNSNSVPFLGSDGMRYVPYAAMDRLLNGANGYDGLIELKAKFERATNEFLGNFDVIRDKYIKDMGAVDQSYANMLERSYPSKQEVQKKFGFTWRLFEVQVPKPIHPIVSGRDAAEIVEANKTQSKMFLGMQHQLQQESLEFVHTAAYSIREQVLEALKRFNNQLISDKTVSSATINSLRNSVDQFVALNFINDNEMQETLSLLRSALDGVDNLKKEENEILRHNLKESMTKILYQAADRNNLDSVIYKFIGKAK